MTKEILTTHILLTVVHDKPIASLTDVAAGRIFMYDHVVDATARLCHIDTIEEVEEKPIDMVLYCPNCGTQHLDLPNPPSWENHPHRSHLCVQCGSIWRPADVPTNGIAALKTKGKADNPVPGFAEIAKVNTTPEAMMAAARGMVFDDPGVTTVDTSALETGVADAVEIPFETTKDLTRFIAQVKGERSVMITLL